MRPLRYYVDTSVWNFLLEEDRPERRQATERFFRAVGGHGLLAISDVVAREVARAPEVRRQALNALLKTHAPQVLEVTVEVEALAEQYIAAGLIPPRYLDDALHLAVTAVYDRDALVSWNFEHLVKLKTRLGVNGLNKMLGYREIEIVSPEEVSFE